MQNNTKWKVEVAEWQREGVSARESISKAQVLQRPSISTDVFNCGVWQELCALKKAYFQDFRPSYPHYLSAIVSSLRNAVQKCLFSCRWNRVTTITTITTITTTTTVNINFAGHHPAVWPVPEGSRPSVAGGVRPSLRTALETSRSREGQRDHPRRPGKTFLCLSLSFSKGQPRRPRPFCVANARSSIGSCVS